MTEEPKTYADKLLLGLQRIEEGQRLLGKGPASFWVEQVKAELRPFWEEQLKIALQALEDSRVENASLLAEQAATEPSAPSDEWIVLDPSPGTDINSAAAKAVKTADARNRRVVLVFNDTHIRVHSGMSATDVVAVWQEEMDQRTKARKERDAYLQRLDSLSAPSDEEIEEAYGEYCDALQASDRFVVHPSLAWKAAVAWAVARIRPTPAAEPDSTKWRSPGWEPLGCPTPGACSCPQPVWEPTPALGTCREEFETWISAHPRFYRSAAAEVWDACWDLLHPQPPEPEDPEDPCEVAYRAHRDGGAFYGGIVTRDIWRAAWAARGEQPS